MVNTDSSGMGNTCFYEGVNPTPKRDISLSQQHFPFIEGYLLNNYSSRDLTKRFGLSRQAAEYRPIS